MLKRRSPEPATHDHVKTTSSSNDSRSHYFLLFFFPCLCSIYLQLSLAIKKVHYIYFFEVLRLSEAKFYGCAMYAALLEWHHPASAGVPTLRARPKLHPITFDETNKNRQLLLGVNPAAYYLLLDRLTAKPTTESSEERIIAY